MLQKDHLFEWLTIYENVLLGLEIQKRKTEESLSHVDRLLQEYGLWNFRSSHPSQLSGGQKRRAALLRALWAGCDTLLLDEPFTGMDPETMKKAAALLKERRGERAVLLATHDREAIRELGWRVIDLT
mgnify:CR=1 FL=1